MYQPLILAPFFSVIIINLLFRHKIKEGAFWFGACLTIAQAFFAIRPSALVFGSAASQDSLTRIMLLAIAIVVFIALVIARSVFKHREERFFFANLVLLILAGLNGVVTVRDVFSLYVYIEIVAVSSYVLIAFHKGLASFEGAFKYIVMSTVATMFMLVAIGLLVFVSGGTEFAVIRASLVNMQHSRFVMLALGIFVCGLSIKAGLMPFHGWLPDAYSEAPSPVSILLAGIITKAAGVYGLIRIVISVFGFSGNIGPVLLVIGVISIVLGALSSLIQNDFKRMLSYSSISQVGYIILGLGCATPLGIAGAVLHLFNHAIFKSLLFVNAAAVETQTGSRDMNKMSGLGSRMPVTGVTSILASLSAAGIPPLAGFWSKLAIVAALWLAGYKLVAVIAVLASVLTLAYLLSMQRRVFFGKPHDDSTGVKEASSGFVFASILLAAVIVTVGVGFPFMLNTFMFPMKGLFGG